MDLSDTSTDLNDVGEPNQVLLSGTQLQLLQLLDESVAAEPQKRGLQAGYDELYYDLAQAEVEVKKLDGEHVEAVWKVITGLWDACQGADDIASLLLVQLRDLQWQQQRFMRKSDELDKLCKGIAEGIEQREHEMESITERMELFNEVAALGPALDATSVEQPSAFAAVLDRMELASDELDKYKDFRESKSYQKHIEHLRTRSCLSMRTALQRSFENAASMVEYLLAESYENGNFDQQMYYSPFQGVASSCKPVTELLLQRAPMHRAFESLLDELEQFYIDLRQAIILTPSTDFLRETLLGRMRSSSLTERIRHGTMHALDVAGFEQQCFALCFAVRPHHAALTELQEQLASVYFDFATRALGQCTSLADLREVVESLQSEFLDAHARTAHDDCSGLRCTLLSVRKLRDEAMLHLKSRAYTQVDVEIKRFVPPPGDLDYPTVLVRHRRVVGAPAAELLFPPLASTLALLAQTYRVLSMVDFEEFARTVVTACIQALRRTADGIDMAVDKDGLGINGVLFLIKHLLLLQEQVAAFECDAVTTDVSSAGGALAGATSRLQVPSAILRLQDQGVEARNQRGLRTTEMDDAVRSACRQLIQDVTSRVTWPLSAVHSTSDPATVTQAAQSFLSAAERCTPVLVCRLHGYFGGFDDTPAQSALVCDHEGEVASLYRAVLRDLIASWSKLRPFSTHLSGGSLTRRGVAIPPGDAASLESFMGELYKRGVAMFSESRSLLAGTEQKKQAGRLQGAVASLASQFEGMASGVAVEG